MAKKVVLQSVCDVCQEPAAVVTFRFGWMMSNYEIDLCPEHSDELNDTMERMVSGARRLGSPSRSVTVATPAPPARSQVSTPEVRAWAKKRGIEVSPKGRVADEVFEKYLASKSARTRSS